MERIPEYIKAELCEDIWEMGVIMSNEIDLNVTNVCSDYKDFLYLGNCGMQTFGHNCCIVNMKIVFKKVDLDQWGYLLDFDEERLNLV